MENTASSKSLMLRGYLPAIVAPVFSALSACCSQALKAAVPDFELSVTRAMMQLIVFAIAGKLAGSDLKVESIKLPALIYLGGAYVLTNAGFYGASAYIPLVEGFGVLMLGTIVTAFLHSRLVFNKDIGKSNVLSAFICAVGIILAIQPAWLFNNQMGKNDITYENVSAILYKNVSESFHPFYIPNVTNNVVLGYGLASIGGIGFGLTYDIGHILLKSVKPITKALYAALFYMISSVALMFYMEEPVFMIDATQWILVLGHGVTSLGANFLTIQAAHYVPGPSMSVICCSEVIVTLVFQYTFMHSIQPGNYNWIEVLGCLIIAFGASMSSLLEILTPEANKLA